MSVSTILGVDQRLKALRVGSGKSQREFARLLSMQTPQWNRYEHGRMPEAKVLQLIADRTGTSVRFLLTGQDAAKPVAAPERKPDWLIPELQEVRSFTAMCYALRRIDKMPRTHPERWRYRVAWDAIVGVSKVLQQIANFTERDWRTIFEKKLDYWERPNEMRKARRSEQETLSQRLQIELGFKRDKDQPGESDVERAPRSDSVDGRP